jgi:LysM repeat protein
VTKIAIGGSITALILMIGWTPAYAGIFSLVTKLFAEEKQEPIIIEATSQKMPLLEAPTNVNLKAGIVAMAEAQAEKEDGALSPANNPVPQTAEVMTAATMGQPTNTISVYVVKEGDSIGMIAEKNNISVNTILWANNLKKNSALPVGKKLKILPVTGIEYKVTSGDTLSGIAAKFKSDVDEIRSINGMDEGDPIKSGQTLIIPDADFSPVVETASASSKNQAGSSNGTSNATSNTKGITRPNESNNGYFIRPINGGTKTQGLHNTNAVDLADSCGTPIYAAAAGQILVSETSGWHGGYGSYVVITHGNGSQTLYGHMKDVMVTEGQTVNQGQQIGTIGATGKVHGVTGCHVHFEIRNGIRNPF